jgi:hypothetical protein
MIHRNHQEETIDNKILIDQINNSNNNLIKYKDEIIFEI